MSLSVVVTPQADSQITIIDDWWRENRRASPDLFLEELSNGFEVLARAPQIGRRYGRSPVAGTRRLLLRATRYHIYYVPVEHEVFVLAVWYAGRGYGPPLAPTAAGER